MMAYKFGSALSSAQKKSSQNDSNKAAKSVWIVYFVDKVAMVPKSYS